MLQTVWAVIREGKIEPLEKVSLPEGAKAIVTFLSDEDDTRFWLSASQYSLAEVWENDGDDIYAELLLSNRVNSHWRIGQGRGLMFQRLSSGISTRSPQA
jgi:hypothetical protein